MDLSEGQQQPWTARSNSWFRVYAKLVWAIRTWNMKHEKLDTCNLKSLKGVLCRGWQPVMVSGICIIGVHDMVFRPFFALLGCDCLVLFLWICFWPQVEKFYHVSIPLFLHCCSYQSDNNLWHKHICPWICKWSNRIGNRLVVCFAKCPLLWYGRCTLGIQLCLSWCLAKVASTVTIWIAICWLNAIPPDTDLTFLNLHPILRNILHHNESKPNTWAWCLPLHPWYSPIRIIVEHIGIGCWG